MNKLGFFIILAVLIVSLGCIKSNDLDIETINGTNDSNNTSLTNSTNGLNGTTNSSGNFTGNEINNTDNLNNTDDLNYTENGIEYNETEELDGMEFGEGKYTLVLDDLSLDKPESCAILSIYNSETKEQLEQLKICPGEEEYWISPEGKKFRIKVIETAPGYSEGAIWANVIVYG